MAEEQKPAETKPEEQKPADAPKKPEVYAMVYFNEANDLKLESKGMDMYRLIGVLRATVRALDDKLAMQGHGAPPPNPAPKG